MSGATDSERYMCRSVPVPRNSLKSLMCRCFCAGCAGSLQVIEIACVPVLCRSVPECPPYPLYGCAPYGWCAPVMNTAAAAPDYGAGTSRGLRVMMG